MDDLTYDPELVRGISRMPPFDLDDLPTTRAAALRQLAEPDMAGVEVRRIEVPGPSGAPPVPLTIYSPAGAEIPGGCIFDIHGGGFVFGSASMMHPANVRLCRDVGAVVASVDYRLAPEHPHPAAIDDCYAGLVGLVERAVAVGIDPNRVAVRGSSAGGGLAAALALMARDRGGPRICFQYLGIPILDDTLATPSMQRFVDTPGWSRRRAEASWDHYLGAGVAGGPSVDSYAAPLRAQSFADLPPAYVTAMEFDPLRDEGIAYAQRLMDAEVSVELHVFPRTFHGSRMLDRASVSRREIDEEAAVLRRALGLSTKPPSS